MSGYRQLTDDVKKQLAAASKKRFQNDPQLPQVRKDIERFKKIRDRKSVSLNEKQRLKEYYDEKAAADKVEDIMDESDKSSSRKKEKNDPLLQETLRIAAEYSILQKKEAGK